MADMKLKHPLLVVSVKNGMGKMRHLTDPSVWGNPKHDAFLGFIEWDEPKHETAGWYELGPTKDVHVVDRTRLASVVFQMTGGAR